MGYIEMGVVGALLIRESESAIEAPFAFTKPSGSLKQMGVLAAESAHLHFKMSRSKRRAPPALAAFQLTRTAARSSALMLAPSSR